MPKGYEVSSKELQDHGTKIKGFATQVTNANAAAQRVGMGGWSEYGVLSIIIWPVLQAFHHDLDENIKSTADLGNALADAIESVRQNYESMEEDAAALLKEFKLA